MAANTDIVRIMIGGSATESILTDGELSALICGIDNPNKAAAAVCRTLATHYALKVDSAIGKLKLSNSQKAEQYADMADMYDKAGNQDLSGLYGSDDFTIGITGISHSDIDAQNANTDRYASVFKRGVTDSYEDDDESQRCR